MMTMNTITHAATKETEYTRLRRELEAAYAQPVWNTKLIDRIANALARLERAAMTRAVFGEQLSMAES